MHMPLGFRMLAWLSFVAVLVGAAILLAKPSRSEPAPPTASQCPTDAPCKVITLTDQELQALTGPNMILDTAQQGRPLDLAGVVTYFRNKIQIAPSGTLPPRPEPKK